MAKGAGPGHHGLADALMFRALVAATLLLSFAQPAMVQDCKPFKSSQDPDFKRNVSANDDGLLCYRVERVKEAGRSWLIQTVAHTENLDGPWWYVAHDNEDAAFDAALYAVRAFGGGFVTLETGEKRSFYGQDPNRNFSKTGQRCLAKRHGSSKFTQAIMAKFEGVNWPILALHTNENGYNEKGGSGTVSVDRQAEGVKGFRSAEIAAAFEDEDVVVITAGDQRFPSGNKVVTVNKMRQAGLNVIHEHVRQSRNDCSLSNYLVLNDTRSYFNLEAQHGEADILKTMIYRVVPLLK